jgi:hypothetical protein
MDIMNPERNAGGIWAYKATDIVPKESKQAYDAIVVVKPIVDFDDYEKGRYSATLATDGKGIIITEPTAPNFIIQDLKKLYTEEERKDHCVYSRVHFGHNTAANAVRGNIARRSKKVLYKFPNDMKCKMGVFNPGPIGSKLQKLPRISEGVPLKFGQTNQLPTFNYACIWTIVLEEPEERQVDLPDGEEDDGITSALKRVYLEEKKK